MFHVIDSSVELLNGNLQFDDDGALVKYPWEKVMNEDPFATPKDPDSNCKCFFLPRSNMKREDYRPAAPPRVTNRGYRVRTTKGTFKGKPAMIVWLVKVED